MGPDGVLRQSLAAGAIHSMVLWGPPGRGKPTLANLVAELSGAHFVSLSAVLSGIADVRKALAEARSLFANGERTILFVDEVHRMNPPQPTIHRVAGVSHYLPHRDDSVTGVLCRKWERLPALRPWPLLSREGVASVIR